MPPLTSIIESFLIASSDGLESGKILELLRARASSLEEDGTLDASTQEEQDTLEEEISQLRALSLGDINQTIEELNLYYASSHRSFHIEDTAFGWKIFTNPDYAPYLEHLYPAPKAHRLSQAALETLAIIAYRQPITKASIEAVRGVSSDGMVQNSSTPNSSKSLAEPIFQDAPSSTAPRTSFSNTSGSKRFQTSPIA